MAKYYALETHEREADLYLFGDITSVPVFESDVSGYGVVKEIAALTVDTLRVHINSYGGEVAEGWAIYNALREHPAHIVTICEGFACSIAAVIFAAGDERVMRDPSMLMIHNAWTYAAGNAEELRREANVLDAMSEQSHEVFRRIVTIDDEELTAMLREDTWLSPAQALRAGFATAVAAEEPVGARQSAFAALFGFLQAQKAAEKDQHGKQPMEEKKKHFFKFKEESRQ